MPIGLEADRGMSVNIVKPSISLFDTQRNKLIPHCWTTKVLKKSVIFVRTKTVNDVRAQVVMHEDILWKLLQYLSTVSEIKHVIPS